MPRGRRGTTLPRSSGEKTVGMSRDHPQGLPAKRGRRNHHAVMSAESLEERGQRENGATAEGVLVGDAQTSCVRFQASRNRTDNDNDHPTHDENDDIGRINQKIEALTLSLSRLQTQKLYGTQAARNGTSKGHRETKSGAGVTAGEEGHTPARQPKEGGAHHGDHTDTDLERSQKQPVQRDRAAVSPNHECGDKAAGIPCQDRRENAAVVLSDDRGDKAAAFRSQERRDEAAAFPSQECRDEVAAFPSQERGDEVAAFPSQERGDEVATFPSQECGDEAAATRILSIREVNKECAAALVELWEIERKCERRRIECDQINQEKLRHEDIASQGVGDLKNMEVLVLSKLVLGLTRSTHDSFLRFHEAIVSHQVLKEEFDRIVHPPVAGDASFIPTTVAGATVNGDSASLTPAVAGDSGIPAPAAAGDSGITAPAAAGDSGGGVPAQAATGDSDGQADFAGLTATLIGFMRPIRSSLAEANVSLDSGDDFCDTVRELLPKLRGLQQVAFSTKRHAQELGGSEDFPISDDAAHILLPAIAMYISKSVHATKRKLKAAPLKVLRVCGLPVAKKVTEFFHFCLDVQEAVLGYARPSETTNCARKSAAKGFGKIRMWYKQFLEMKAALFAHIQRYANYIKDLGRTGNVGADAFTLWSGGAKIDTIASEADGHNGGAEGNAKGDVTGHINGGTDGDSKAHSKSGAKGLVTTGAKGHVTTGANGGDKSGAKGFIKGGANGDAKGHVKRETVASAKCGPPEKDRRVVVYY